MTELKIVEIANEIQKELNEDVQIEYCLHNGKKEPFIKIGYWQKMPNQIYEKYKHVLSEYDDSDEDRKTWYSYHLKKNI